MERRRTTNPGGMSDEPAPRSFAMLVGVAVLAGIATLPALCRAQPPVSAPRRVHYPWSHVTSPGVAGSWQVLRGVGPAGYFQPVHIVGPEGMHVRIPSAEDSQSGPQPAPVNAGMLVGQVYRIELSGLPGHPGRSLWPTVEILDRLYPPIGSETKHPVVVAFSQEEFDLALEGHLVTKVIYLEEADRSLPLQHATGTMPVLDVGPGGNPLKAADLYGRPMAIVRLGEWAPLGSDAVSGPFQNGAPPVLFPEENEASAAAGAYPDNRKVVRGLP